MDAATAERLGGNCERPAGALRQVRQLDGSIDIPCTERHAMPRASSRIRPRLLVLGICLGSAAMVALADEAPLPERSEPTSSIALSSSDSARTPSKGAEAGTAGGEPVTFYPRGEVVQVRGRRVDASVKDERIAYRRIERSDATSVERILSQASGARVQTNSRGESLLYLRGAGERQTALFLDGALLNVPWDNRIDLSLLPAGMLGGLTLSKGASSVLYGANTLGGAVNLVSRDLRGRSSLSEASVQGGPNGTWSTTGVQMVRHDQFSGIIAAGHATRDGRATADFAGYDQTSFGEHQSDRHWRTNTDSRLSNVYARGEWASSEEGEVGLSIGWLDAEKGIAPEGHGASKPRFWRYPLYRHLHVGLNGEREFGGVEPMQLRGAVWTSRFSQDIDQYKTDAYEQLSAREEDRDVSYGGRVVAMKKWGAVTTSLSLNALEAVHEQRDIAFADGTPVFEDALGRAIPTHTYEQRTWSTGLETGWRATERLALTAGASWDGMETPETGDKPSYEGFTDWSAILAATQELGAGLSLEFSGGRKTRFPTMRELYGEALGRFLINPDLKPEEAWLCEAGWNWTGAKGGIAAAAFGNLTRDAIEQRQVGKLRQRINLPGSTTWGGEISGMLRPWQLLRMEGNLTAMRIRGFATASDGTDSTFRLAEKPAWMGNLLVEGEWRGLQPSTEVQTAGGAYGLANDGSMVALGDWTTVNFRIAYRMPAGRSDRSSLQLFVRVDNAFDVISMPQMGLPAAGREVQAGVKMSM